MKKVKVQEAICMELCHDITEMNDGFKGVAFKRGHIIRQEDVEHMLNIGKRMVFVWEEHAEEVHEDDCARRMAAMAPVESCHYTEPAEGKVLLFADQRGMFRVNRKLLNRIDSIGDITICTLPDHYPVEAGARLASMRIVPLVTKEEQILEAENLDFKLFLPLIAETANKVQTMQPKEAQTGPMVRYDVNVMNKQMNMLTNERMREIYRLMAESIHADYTPTPTNSANS